MNKTIIIPIIMLLIGLSFALGIPFRPRGNIEGGSLYNITGFDTISASEWFINNTKITKEVSCVVDINGAGDYTDIQSCINALRDGTLSVLGGTIYIKQGIYNSNQINITQSGGDVPTTAQRFKIIGDSRANTYINFTGNGFMFFMVSNANVQFYMSDLYIYGDGTGYGLSADQTNHAFPSYSLFERIQITNFARGINIENASMISTTFRDVRTKNNDYGIYIEPNSTDNVYSNMFDTVRSYGNKYWNWYLNGTKHDAGIRQMSFYNIDSGNCNTTTKGGFYGEALRSVIFINPYAECGTGSRKTFVLNGENIIMEVGSTYLHLAIGTNATTNNVWIRHPFETSNNALDYEIEIGPYANYTVLDMGVGLLNANGMYNSLTITDNGKATQIIGVYKDNDGTFKYGYGNDVFFKKNVTINDTLNISKIKVDEIKGIVINVSKIKAGALYCDETRCGIGTTSPWASTLLDLGTGGALRGSTIYVYDGGAYLERISNDFKIYSSYNMRFFTKQVNHFNLTNESIETDLDLACDSCVNTEDVGDIDKDDIEGDLNTFVDIAGDTMTTNCLNMTAPNSTIYSCCVNNTADWSCS